MAAWQFDCQQMHYSNKHYATAGQHMVKGWSTKRNSGMLAYAVESCKSVTIQCANVALHCNWFNTTAL
jgi:hypothetical protein